MTKITKMPPNAGKGRKKGVPNKTTALLKDAILMAAAEAGQGNIVDYLKLQAVENPGPFLALLGKVLPMQANANLQPGLTVIIDKADAACL